MSIKIQTAFEIRFFPLEFAARQGAMAGTRAFFVLFYFSKMERLAVKPILMRMGCSVF
jgi:hypothetical protein